MTKEEVLQYDKKFRYMLLSRLQADCEYYLNYGNRNTKRLWAGNNRNGCQWMKYLTIKRECLSLSPDTGICAAAVMMTVAAF